MLVTDGVAEPVREADPVADLELPDDRVPERVARAVAVGNADPVADADPVAVAEADADDDPVADDDAVAELDAVPVAVLELVPVPVFVRV